MIFLRWNIDIITLCTSLYLANEMEREKNCNSFAFCARICKFIFFESSNFASSVTHTHTHTRTHYLSLSLKHTHTHTHTHALSLTLFETHSHTHSAGQGHGLFGVVVSRAAELIGTRPWQWGVLQSHSPILQWFSTYEDWRPTILDEKIFPARQA